MASHLLHQALHNGHAQAGTLIDAAGIRVFLGKGVENVLQKLLTHADAGIADRPAVDNVLLVLFHHLGQRGDGAAHLVILDAVGVNIQENLPQVDGASVDPEIRGLVRVFIEGHGNAGLRRSLSNNRQNLLPHPVRVHRLVSQCGLAAFQLAHLQHIIQQRHQVVRRYTHLLPVAVNLFPILRVGSIHLQQANDAIQRCADVMAHTGEEAALGGVCPFRLDRSLPKLPVLLLKHLGVSALLLHLLLLVAQGYLPLDDLLRYQKQAIDNQRKQQVSGSRIEDLPL